MSLPVHIFCRILVADTGSRQQRIKGDMTILAVLYVDVVVKIQALPLCYTNDSISETSHEQVHTTLEVLVSSPLARGLTRNIVTQQRFTC